MEETNAVEPTFAPVGDPEPNTGASALEQNTATAVASDETRAPEEEGEGGNPSDPSKPPVQQPPTKEQY